MAERHGLPLGAFDGDPTGTASSVKVTDTSDGMSFVHVASGTTDAQGIAAQAGLRLMGFSVTEDAATAAAAEVALRHGTLATDTELFGVTLVANESVREFFLLGGIDAPNGIFVDRVSGTTKLTLFYKID